ncbi:Peptidase M16 domain protein [Alteracholeplasma palmae J233]|uniref:Peptidase M16 domain protein n=1 Tax=Alteracholeplasma palmae (strain ATCC 49389 / J233) TaxID=1318466 RepID=U4KL46_ALTPJ|nr:pitrilysin family protein [Alteracholeplasma palmae]CCV64453.1 Peptidase M16 domain protein [Alteracholeplasma palmae J233]
MKNNLNYNERYSFKTKNGMEVILLKDHSASIYVQLDVSFGSLDLTYIKDEQEYDLSPGIAHFLEHKIFAMADGTDAFMKLTSLGLQANAMTSYQTTSYTLVGNDNIKEGLKYLLEMLDNPYFTDENIDQEYNIIAEEIKMYDDDVDSYIQNIVLNMMYHDHSIKHDIAGTIETIEFITPQMLEETYNYFYQPVNRKLYISGNFDFKEMEDFLNEVYPTLNENQSPVKKTLLYEHYEVKEAFKSIELSNIKNKLSMGIKFDYKTDNKIYLLKEEIKAVIALNLLVGSLSDFYEKTIEEGILSEQLSFQLINERNVFSIFLQADTNDIETLDFLIKKVLITPPSESLTEDALEKVKRILIGHHIFSVNEFEYKLYLFSKYYPLGVTLDDIILFVKEVSIDDIKAFLANINADMFSTLYVYSNDEF